MKRLLLLSTVTLLLVILIWGSAFAGERHQWMRANEIKSMTLLGAIFCVAGVSTVLATKSSVPRFSRSNRFSKAGNRVGKLIREQRNKLGWSQEKLARKLCVSGAYVSKLEKGTSTPSNKLCKKLVNALGIDRETLLLQAIEQRESISVHALIPFNAEDKELTERESYYVKLIRSVPADVRDSVFSFLSEALKYIKGHKSPYKGGEENVGNLQKNSNELDL
jgi:transcriptional regulator with XRE-family HTH domain